MSRFATPKKVLKKILECFKKVDISINNVNISNSTIMEQKVCVVTGASSGIGKSICEELINCGAFVVGIARNMEKMEQLTLTYPKNFVPVVYDVLDVDNIDMCISNIEQLVKGKNIDVLINCAGAKNGNDERFFDFTPEEFDEVVGVNTKAIFFWCQKMAKYMIERKVCGHIVNIASIKGFIGEASPYGVSKWGCVGLTKGLGRLLAQYGIVVNGVAPGATATPMAHYNEGDSLVHLDTSSMRMAMPQEIAKLVVFLASDFGNNVIGQVIISDGGQTLQYLNRY